MDFSVKYCLLIVIQVFVDTDDEDIIQKPDSWYYNTIGTVWDVIHEAGLLLETISNLTTLPIWELYKWTGAAEDIADLYLLHLQGGEENKLQVLLHLTALLERSLGNVSIQKLSTFYGKCISH